MQHKEGGRNSGVCDWAATDRWNLCLRNHPSGLDIAAVDLISMKYVGGHLCYHSEVTVKALLTLQ